MLPVLQVHQMPAIPNKRTTRRTHLRYINNINHKTKMKQYTITQHPFKLIIEFDDQWLVRFDIGEPEMQEIADGLDDVLKKRAVTLHALAAQQDASENMNGKPEPYPELPE